MENRSTTNIVARALLFVMVAPVVVTLVVPLFLVRSPLNHAATRFNAGPLRWLALPLIAAGVLIFAWTVADFVVRGRGTPNPNDPPTRLVTSGPNRVSRNPMYVALVTVILGEAIWFGSSVLLFYAALLFTITHLRVISYEEPALRALFGNEYEAYMRRVPRWLLRL